MNFDEINKSDIVKVIDLNIDLGDLDPIISKESLDFHYNVLAKNYENKYNKKEGDLEFLKAAVFLHNKFFEQLKKYDKNNNPKQKFLQIINNDFEKFKQQFKKIALFAQGSTWVYLSKSGDIKVIQNHETVDDIVVILDMWEHSWMLDYEEHKDAYIDSIWYIINWDIIENRI